MANFYRVADITTEMSEYLADHVMLQNISDRPDVAEYLELQRIRAENSMGRTVNPVKDGLAK